LKKFLNNWNNMAGSTFGQLFRITTFGESHGGAVGVVIDGCPPNIEITEEEIQKDLDKRKPGQSDITSPRKEQDLIHILSGVVDGKTTGTPILLLAYNKDVRSEDYGNLRNLYRPGHADYTFQMKYGIRDYKGSGRASARETLARVAAGAIAKKYLKEKLGIEFLSYVEQVGDIKTDVDFETVNPKQIEANIVRCPDDEKAKEMIKLIEEVRDDGDSIGGVIRGVIKNVPVGLGEPVFDKLPADLGKAILSINATKGFEYGSGFEGVKKRGSQHNDEFYTDESGKIRTKTNNAGGTLGGISSGETIYFRVAFKPVSTISKKQRTVDKEKHSVELEATGRHDPCVLPRAVPIVDAMGALVIMDHYLRHKAQNL
jgi:chorismate synthase